MTIPLPRKYMDPELGIGKLANYQSTQADTKVSTEKIPFGSPVEATENTVKVLADGTFFGVAIAENYAKEITYDNVEKVGEYPVNKPVAVLRKGSIWVKAVEDVKESEPATATADGFKKATTAEETIGVFQSTAQADGLVMLQINLP